MSTDPVKTESSLEEQLVAYLDGELDAESVRRIEERLASEPEVREALNRLERTWEMLDELGSTPVNESFTQTTLEMVTVAAEEDVEHVLAEVPVRRRRLFWLAIGGALAAITAGFYTVFLLLPNPNRQLIADLPLLENLEEYRQIDDIEFLRLLRDHNKEWFPKTQKEQAESAAKAYPRLEDMSAFERASWVELQSADKKSDLWRNEKNFNNLSETEQRKLYRLYDEIQKDPDADELRRIMHDYYVWWKVQSPFIRNELSMTVQTQKRVKRIEQLKKDEARLNPLKDFPQEDFVVLQEWIERKFEESYRESMVSAKARRELGSPPDEQRPWELWRVVFGPRGQGGGQKALKMPDDMDQLGAKLSPQTQRLLEGKTPEEQWKTIQRWLPEVGRRLIASRMSRRIGPRMDENELADFLENVPEEQRFWLLDLPPEELRHTLQRMYYPQKKAKESFMNHSEGPPPGGPRRPFGPPPDNPDQDRPNRPEKLKDSKSS